MNIKPNKDGIIESLPVTTQLGNALCALAHPLINPLTFSACAQWVYNTWRANKSGKFQWPVTLEIFNYLTGMSCIEVAKILKAYGIPAQTISMMVELWPNKRGVGIRKSFWVPRSQAAMADAILRQYASGFYSVESPFLGVRAKFGQPWGVPAQSRSWDETVTDIMYGFMDNKVSAMISTGKTEKPQALPTKADERRQSPTVKRRKSAKTQSSLKRIAKGIWNA